MTAHVGEGEVDELGLQAHERVLYEQIRAQAERRGIPPESWVMLAKVLPKLDLDELTVGARETWEILGLSQPRLSQLANDVRAYPWMKPWVQKQTAGLVTDRLWLRAWVQHFAKIRTRRGS